MNRDITRISGKELRITVEGNTQVIIVPGGEREGRPVSGVDIGNVPFEPVINPDIIRRAVQEAPQIQDIDGPHGTSLNKIEEAIQKAKNRGFSMDYVRGSIEDQFMQMRRVIEGGHVGEENSAIDTVRKEIINFLEEEFTKP